MRYWLLKTEPEDYAFADLQAAGEDTWDGVRNFAAQKHLRTMSPGDLVFIYHTGKEKAVVGVAEVSKAAYPDPGDPSFVAVSLRARHPLQRPVTLKQIKAAPKFAEWELVRLPRLSVMPVTAEHWQAVHALARSL